MLKLKKRYVRHTSLCCIQFRKLISWDLLLSTYSLRTFMGGIPRENEKNCTRKLVWKPFGSFLTCVLKSFHMECKIEACCPNFIIATFHLLTQNLTYFLFFFISHPKVLLIFLLPWSLLPAIGSHSLAARLKPMVIDLWRLAGLPIFHFSSIFRLHLRLWVPVQPQRLSLSSQSMHCSRDSLVGKLRGENVLKLIMASCDENIWSVVGTCCLPRQDRCCTQNEQNNFLQEFNCQTLEKSSSILRSAIPLRNKGPKVAVVT